MGTMQKLTIHDMPEYNSIVEHLNHTLLEKVQVMIHASDLPKNLCVPKSTCALKNKTPFEMLAGKKPNIANLCEFSTKVWVHNTSGNKLDGHSYVGHWVGFDEVSNGHRIY
jgi:hypothetical protein